MTSNGTAPINVAVVHPCYLTRTGLWATLGREPGFAPVQCWERLDDLMAAVDRKEVPEPCVVLLLATLPVESVCSAIRRWQRRHGGVPVVAIGELTMPMAQRLWQQGVLGTLHGSVLHAELVECLRSAAGDRVYGNDWLRAVAHGPRHARQQRAQAQPDLSPRELQVLRLLNRPDAPRYKTIAALCAVGVRTIHSYRDNLFEKFDVDSRQALLKEAARLGFFQ